MSNWCFIEQLPESHPARVEPLVKFNVEWRPRCETKKNWSAVLNGRLTFNTLSLEMRRNNEFRVLHSCTMTALPPGQTVREG